MDCILLLPVLLPIICSLALWFFFRTDRKSRNIYVIAVTLLTSAAVFLVVITPPEGSLVLLRFAKGLALELKIDGMSRIFAGMVAFLWPLTTLYSFDYMEHEGHEDRFFAFFLLSYGVVLGVAFAGNLVTMYMFFEMLTLATLPLVMHKMDNKARFAGRRYLIYSLTGASLGLIAVVFLSVYGTGGGFTMGGVLDPALAAGHESLLRAVFVISFFGFGVKAALLPMSLWLPSASVAPTPVTALLHAVAVVKAGVFACIRLTYYCFGTELLAGTAAQYTVMTAAILTIVVGSAMALRSGHLKRRLAWSTVSNLSYILLGVTVMTPAGLTGGVEHMLFHAFIKITLFFCAGAVLEKSGHEYIDEIDGLSGQMPVTFACFTVASLALMGMPPLIGFFSKWDIGTAAAALGTPWGYAGVAALVISALLTALYMIGVIVRAYSPKRDDLPGSSSDVIETPMMSIPIAILTLCILLLSCFSGQIRAMITSLLF